MGKAQLLKLPRKFPLPEQTPPVIALAGNPNTGKSTIFNLLTGLKQHTGNWPGKTVLLSSGSYYYQRQEYKLVDLPGTYSLLANSPDEESARDFLCFARPQATVVVADATCLERNLNLILQVLEITSQMIVCVNLLDEAKRKHISLDLKALEVELGVPVVATTASRGRGINRLKEAIKDMAAGRTNVTPRRIIYDEEVEMALQQIQFQMAETLENCQIDRRFLALRLLDGDQTLIRKAADHKNLEDKVWAQSLLK